VPFGIVPSGDDVACGSSGPSEYWASLTSGSSDRCILTGLIEGGFFLRKNPLECNGSGIPQSENRFSSTLRFSLTQNLIRRPYP